VIGERVRRDIERLVAGEAPRGSATPGEAAAARLLRQMFLERGVEATIEQERAVVGFWLPTGLLAAAGAVAGAAGGRRRLAGALLAGCAGLLMADDVENGPHLLRRLLPKRTTDNVLAWVGDPDAEQTLVLVAHHDAAHTGLLFHPGLVPLVNRLAPAWYAKQKTSTQTGRLLVAGPLLSALGCALRSKTLRKAGLVWSAVTTALLADVARSAVVEGANDNLSAVAVLLALAEDEAVREAKGIRLLLLSTGSEETFMEGMRGFVTRHRDRLDPDRTRFVALECVGSPRLILLEGEGMLRMHDYDEQLREQIQEAAEEAGIGLWRGLRLGAGGTDALPAMRAGYRAACLAGCTELKVPANYHWPTDTVQNLSWETIDEARGVLARLISRSAAERTPGLDSAPARSEPR
jgi:Peptidase family M28